MRIITGTLKGRKIPVPDTGDLRPTSDRTKEGMFAVISARRYFEGCRVLDLFAGSGNLGFEAISRGAGLVLFVDRNRDNLVRVEKTAREFGVQTRISTRVQPVEEFLKREAAPYDLIFCDPPYDYAFMSEMPEIILHNGWLDPEGWYILEHDKRHDFSGHPHCFYSRAYGRTIVSIFQSQPVDSQTGSGTGQRFQS